MPVASPQMDFVEAAVAQILEDQRFEAFLQWMREKAPQTYPEVFRGARTVEDHRSMTTHVALALWNVTPLPRTDFRPEPRKPERNRPCPCGSGSKYKRCCLRGPSPPPLPDRLLWLDVFDQLPESELGALGRSPHLPPDVQAQMAFEALADETPRRAARLLEPLLERPERLGEKHWYCLEKLLDAYDELGWTAKKQEALEALTTRGAPPVAAGGHRRLATIAADAEDWDGAWRAFDQARELAPTEVAGHLLEVTLLLIQGRHGEGADRARFLLAQADRGRLPQLGPTARSLLERAVADPSTAFAATATSPDTRDVERFRDLVEKARDRPLPDYRLADAAAMPVLETPPSVKVAEDAWNDLWSDVLNADPLDTGAGPIWHPATAHLWLDLLEAVPECWDSLQVLAKLTQVAWRLETPQRDVAERFILPLTERIEALLADLLPPTEGAVIPEATDDDPFPGLLPWIALDNRDALRLLMARAVAHQDAGDPAAAEALLERLLSLNPHDNQGARAMLINLRLGRGDDEGALDLAGKYPEDAMIETLWGRVLALYRLGRRGEALSALAEAHRRNPHVPGQLLSPKQGGATGPDTLLGYAAGGEAIARKYARDVGDLWHGEPGLAKWLRSAHKGLSG